MRPADARHDSGDQRERNRQGGETGRLPLRGFVQLPNGQMCRAHCRNQGRPPNVHHTHEHFSLSYVKQCMADRTDIEVVHERRPVGICSFELVVRKSRHELLDHQE